jgi:hypothetical protein
MLIRLRDPDLVILDCMEPRAKSFVGKETEWSSARRLPRSTSTSASSSRGPVQSLSLPTSAKKMAGGLGTKGSRIKSILATAEVRTIAPIHFHPTRSPRQSFGWTTWAFATPNLFKIGSKASVMTQLSTGRFSQN